METRGRAKEGPQSLVAAEKLGMGILLVTEIVVWYGEVAKGKHAAAVGQGATQRRR